MRDTEAVASIVAGDPDGLATAYDRYADPLFTYCQSLLGDTAEAADAVQDTFVIAAARLNGLDDPQRLRAWLFAVARGECLRVLGSGTRARTPRAARDVTGDAAGLARAGDAAHARDAAHAGETARADDTPNSGGTARTVDTRNSGDTARTGDTANSDDTARAGGTARSGGTAHADGTGSPGAAGGDDERAGRAGLRALFEHAAAGLGLGEREVVELRLRQGLDPAEMATVLGVSRGRAQTLASRATDELETCLAVLLVGRSGRDECAELGSLLAGWDGRLTAALTKRAGRHIAHCSACGARRAVELRPSALLELAPAAALAAGAAESFRQAAGAPADLRAHTIALAAGGGSASAAHTTAVLTRAGSFDRQGFPKPAHAARGALGAGGVGGAAGGAGWSRPGVPSSPRGRAAVAAAVVLAVGAAVTGFALSNGQHPAPVADPKPTVSSADPLAATGRAVSSAAARASTALPAASGRSSAARASTPAAVTVTQTAVTTPATVPTTAGPSQSPSSTPTTASPSATASASQPAGTLRVFPGGGSIFLVPGGRGALLFLSASGGAVDWSVSVSGDPGHSITVSPGTSGTLTAAQPHATLEISASRSLSCGGGTPCPTITVEPGGTVLTVTTSGRRHPFSHRRRQHRHDGLPAAAPLGPPAGGSTATPPAGGSTVTTACRRQHRHDGLPAAAPSRRPAGGRTVRAACRRSHCHVACRRRDRHAACPAAAVVPDGKALASTCTHNNAFIKRYQQSRCRRATNPLR